MKNRTVLGIICMVLSLAVTFGAAPLVNRFSDGRTAVVRITRDVGRGRQITDSDVEEVEVGSYNLPAGVLKKREDAVGMFAAADLAPGDYVFPSKITRTSERADDVFMTLDGGRQAMSITIQSFAGGLSGKLRNGDIVRLVVYRPDRTEAVTPGALTYMRVITTTTPGGADRDELVANEDGTYELPSTVTLMVNEVQARLLVEYENRGKIHVELVFRGDEETAKKFLDAQDEYFRRIESEPDDENGEETEGEEGDEAPFDIVKYANDIINGRTPAYLPGGDSYGG